MKLSALLSQSFRDHAARVAMYDEARSWTYAELASTVDAWASGLTEYGIRPGDRVAFLLPNSPELVFVNLACCKLGAVAVPLNIRLTGNELVYNLNHSAARLCLVHATLWPVLQPYLSRLTAAEKLFVVGAEAGRADAEGLKRSCMSITATFLGTMRRRRHRSRFCIPRERPHGQKG